MIRINLLPWREAARARAKRNLGVGAVAAVAITALIGLGVHTLIGERIAYQGSRNELLTGEIRQLDKQLQEIKDLENTKTRMIARMTIIQQLQASRPAAVHLLDEIVTSLPDGVFLTGMQQGGSAVTLKGRAQSNARVSGLMRNIEGASWIGNPTLAVVENKERTGTGLNHFQVNLHQQTPKQADTGQSITPERGGRSPN